MTPHEKIPWFMTTVVEECGEVVESDSRLSVEVTHYYIQDWAFPILLLIQARRDDVLRWFEWPVVLWRIIELWGDFLSKHPEAGRRVRLYARN